MVLIYFMRLIPHSTVVSVISVPEIISFIARLFLSLRIWLTHALELKYLILKITILFSDVVI